MVPNSLSHAGGEQMHAPIPRYVLSNLGTFGRAGGEDMPFQADACAFESFGSLGQAKAAVGTVANSGETWYRANC